MLAFSKDRDILKYEPLLFGELHFHWQVLCAGTEGEIDGTGFVVSSEDFVSAGVQAGGVIYLKSDDGELDGAYEIVSVDSATELIVSVLRADDQSSAVAPVGGENISYRVSTFLPQAAEVLFNLTQYFGIRPGNPNSTFGVGDILDISVLRQASVYAILASVYATLASTAEDQGFWNKSLYYQKLAGKARERCRLSIDIGSDGVSDRTNVGGSVQLVRD